MKIELATKHPTTGETITEQQIIDSCVAYIKSVGGLDTWLSKQSNLSENSVQALRIYYKNLM